jgi:dTDP-4-amino-4,6-dideoxy-D-glucose acyltransferase
MSFYSEEELVSLGLKSFGNGVKISRKSSIYNAKNISIGDHSRIDDFCVLSAGTGGINIGRNVHVAVFSALIGGELIDLHDYSGLSSRVSIYSSNDDYSGEFMTNPTLPKIFTNIKSGPVVIGKHVIVGAGSIILPGVTMAEGSGAGALSLLRQDCEAFGMYVGVPARKVGSRSRSLLELEKKLIKLQSKT